VIHWHAGSDTPSVKSTSTSSLNHRNGTYDVFGMPLAASLASAAVTLTVNFSSVVRSDYVGQGGVLHGFFYMKEDVSLGMNATYRNLSYSRAAAARVAAVRTWYAPDWVMPGGWGTGLDFMTPRFEQFCDWISDMQSLNIPVVWNAGWWFTQNSCGTGKPANCTPSNASLAVYTKWISATARELVVNRGFKNAATLLLFTEPLSYDSGIVPPGYTQVCRVCVNGIQCTALHGASACMRDLCQESYYVYVIRALHERMVADGTRDLVAFMGPNGDADVAGVQVSALPPLHD
jgi:hypothetical protein